MAQYNLFNPDDVRVGLLIFYSSNMERAWRNIACLIPISLSLWHTMVQYRCL